MTAGWTVSPPDRLSIRRASGTPHGPGEVAKNANAVVSWMGPKPRGLSATACSIIRRGDDAASAKATVEVRKLLTSAVMMPSVERKSWTAGTQCTAVPVHPEACFTSGTAAAAHADPSHPLVVALALPDWASR